MGFHSEWHISIQAEMAQDVYSDIPDHLKEQMKVKRIDAPDFKDLYRKDEEWKELNDKVKEALQERTEREAQIRIENK